MREILFLTIHCSAGPQDQSTQSIKNYWANVLGWRSYGYHYLINKDGSIEELTPLEKPTNGVKGYNANSIHICYKGGEKGVDNRTQEKKESMVKLLRYLRTRFPKAKIKGHRDFSPDLNKNGIIEPREYVKLCPGFDVATWLKSVGL